MATKTEKKASKKSVKAAEKKAAEVSPAVPSIAIPLACAAAMCQAAPLPGRSYCAEHQAQRDHMVASAEASRAVEAAKSALATMAGTHATATALLASAPSAPAAAPAVSGGLVEMLSANGWNAAGIAEALRNKPDLIWLDKRAVSKSKAALPAEGITAMLEAHGWSPAYLVQSLALKPERLWLGKEVKALKSSKAPKAKGARKGGKKEAVVTGSLKAPAEPTAAAARSVSVSSLPDPRQLALDLQGTLDRVLGK